MKKLFTVIAGLLLLLTGLWLGTTWFIGVQTEKQVRQYFQETKGRHELVSYQHSFLHATANTRSDVSQTPLGQWLDKLPLQHRINHGPLFWRPSPAVGLSYWETRLNWSDLAEDGRDWLTTVFESEPLKGWLMVDLGRNISYQATLSPLVVNSDIDELVVSLTGLTLKGQQAAQSTQSTERQLTGQQSAGVQITLNQLQLGMPELDISVPEILIRQSIESESGTDNAENTKSKTRISWEVDNTKLLLNGGKMPVQFDSNGEWASQTESGQLSGDITLILSQFSGLTYPLQDMNFKLEYTGLNMAALQEINRLQNHMQDIQAQLEWQEEALELPEKRRELFQLELQLYETTDQLLNVLFQKALQANQSTLNSRLQLTVDDEAMTAETKLHYAGVNQPVTLDELMQAGLQDWLAFFRGDIRMDLAQNVLEGELPESLLSYPIQQQGLVASAGHYRMDLRLLDNTAELNGRVVAYPDLAGHFFPQSMGGGQAIPDEVWRLVEEQGLSEEFLNQLEQRDDITPDMIELLRQLHDTTKTLN